jgi:hypothetical protein
VAARGEVSWAEGMAMALASQLTQKNRMRMSLMSAIKRYYMKEKKVIYARVRNKKTVLRNQELKKPAWDPVFINN